MNASFIESLESRTLFAAGAMHAPAQPKVILAAAVNDATLATSLANAVTFASSQLKQTMTDISNNTSKFVNTTNHSTGKWNVVTDDDWTSGFLGGAMWQMFQATGDSFWSGKATAWTTPLAGEATAQTADLYFRLMSTYLPLYQQTGNPAYAQVLLNAAASHETMWNQAIGAFQCDWGSTNSGNPLANFGVLMDQTSDNLLMLWAAQQSGNQTYYNQAVQSTRTVIAHMIRPDGSTYQFGYFNATSGSFIDGETSQGYSNSSTWSRGQAWAIYTLTAIARITGLSDILSAAQNVANYYISHLPADSVPYWDFNSPAIPNTYRDSSAAAIATSGLLDLSTLTTNSVDANSDLTCAQNTLSSLASTAYLAEGTNSHGILLHGAQNVPNTPANDDVSLIVGDYFFLQAINRYDAIATNLPAYVVPTSGAVHTWEQNSGNLCLSTGTLIFTDDSARPAYTADALLNLVVDGATSAVVFNNTLSPVQTTQHISSLTLENGGSAQIALTSDHNAILFTNALSIDSASKLNITNNQLIVSYTGSSPIAALQHDIATGYAGGAWSGPGIVTTSGDIHHGIGYLDNAAGQITIKYALYGDANLDGTVNFADLLVLSQSYGSTGTSWSHGDFNYDQTTNFSDLLVLSQNYNASL